MTRADNVGQRVCVVLVSLFVTVLVAAFARHDVEAPQGIGSVGGALGQRAVAAAESSGCAKSRQDTHNVICVRDELWGKIVAAEAARWQLIRDSMWRLTRQADYRQVAWAPTLSCPFEQRIGDLAVGGKWVCGVEQLGLGATGDCVVYSFGIGGKYSFEVELLNKTQGRCSVELLDPVADVRFTPRVEQLSVYQMGVVGAGKEHTRKKGRFRSIENVLKSENRTLWLMKMDIEGAERFVLPDIALLPAKQRPYQLLVEMHWRPNMRNEMDKILLKLRAAGYVMFHMERNFQCDSCTEVSFINLASRSVGTIEQTGFDLVTRTR